MELEIREATIDNLEDILDFNQQLFDYDIEKFDKTLNCNWPSNNEKYFRESIEKDDSLALVVFVDDKLVGYLIGGIKKPGDYRVIKQIAEIENMFILSEHRGKGVGVLLCEKFIGWAEKRGVKRVKVVASAQNKGAISCYKKCGFYDYDLVLEKDL